MSKSHKSKSLFDLSIIGPAIRPASSNQKSGNVCGLDWQHNDYRLMASGDYFASRRSACPVYLGHFFMVVVYADFRQFF